MSQAEPELHYVTDEAFLAAVRAVADRVARADWTPDFVVGIGRGGLVPAVYVSHQLDVPMLSVDHSSKQAEFADELLRKVAEKSARGTRLLFIDDINDSGNTIAYVRQLLRDHGSNSGNLRFAVLLNNMRSKVDVDYWAQTIDRAEDKRWFVFPWEAVETSAALLEAALAVPERLA